MFTKPISGTDITPSCICLGTAEMGTVMNEPDSFRMLDFYVDHGGSFLDSALVYGDMVSAERGMSEKTVGRWLKARGNRGRVIVATKGAHPDLATMKIPRLSRADVESDLDQSLQNLGVDCIDLYWLHRDDPRRDVGEIVETLDRQVRAGKIRYFGLSNWQLPRFAAALDFTRAHGLSAPVASQILWSLAEPNSGVITDPTIAVMDGVTWEYHHRESVAVIPFTAQARGFFTKMAQGLPLQGWVRATYESPQNLSRLQRALQLAEKHGVPLEAVVLAWLTNQPFPTIPIISARDTAQLEVSLSAGNLVLTEQEIEWLEGGV